MKSARKTLDKHKKPIQVGCEVNLMGGKMPMLVVGEPTKNKFALSGLNESFFGNYLRRTDDKN
jgi:hypothetical protein